MRQVKTGLLLAGVLLLSGCSNINPRPKPTDVGRRWDSRQPNSATLVAYLDAHEAPPVSACCWTAFASPLSEPPGRAQDLAGRVVIG